MELLTLLLEIVEAPGTFGCLRKCDFPYNAGGDRFKRVGDVAIVFRLPATDRIAIYILVPGAPFGMAESSSSEDIRCRQATNLRSEDYQNTPQWKKAVELLKQQWNDVVAADFIANARAAMRA